ncbi:AAA family ATPase [Nocardia sp. NEAU-G5]|uniref:AAA family ATPase n=1 Tax=Nocardia albiluteola TaxID=2842303 RepID=A0ABS6BB62_9NOCA|nr:AAA family ATPase [Nocardia albiluteola]MBU3067509.1 AAA family ATPase [Nocardia albiluteola]
MSAGHAALGVGIPTDSDGFVGRDRELDRIASLLSDSARLITLVGSGGIGKTRLAMAVARRMRRAQLLPVHWVYLARLPKGASVGAIEDEIVGAVVDGDYSARPGRQTLIDTLGRTDAVGRVLPTVLVLDNCEHVLDEVGEVVAELLDAVPGLTVLATSRTAIGWVDEHVVPIPPLTRAQAVALFRQRADLAGRPVADADLPVVESICRHLHCYPLHIRLAAARLRYQSLPMILRDLDGAGTDRRLRWSPGFRVGADERHRDLSAVIGWSFELCDPAEQLLFQRMSVFAIGHDNNPDDIDLDAEGGYCPDVGADLAAIEAVCADTDHGGLARDRIEGLLERLVDRSMVSIHVGADTVRYSLLESFRVFAQQRLREGGDGEWLRLAARHRRYYRDRIAEYCIQWLSPREQELLARARADSDNQQCAVDGSLSDPDEAVVGLEIATGLIALRIPFLRGHLRESRALAERSLAAARALGQCPAELEVSALALIGWLSLCQGVRDDALRMLDDAVAICLEPQGLSQWPADPATDLGLPASVEYLWGSTLMLVDCDARATMVLARARSKFAAAGDLGGVAMAELFEALAAALLGSAEQAMEVTGRHLVTFVSSGAAWATSWARLARAIAEAAHGDPNAAMALCDTALAWQIPMRDRWGGVWAVHIRAWILAAMIDATAAEPDGSRDRIRQWAREIAWISGGTSTLRRQLGIDLNNLRPFGRKTVEADALARKVLGDREFEIAARRGLGQPEAVLAAGDPGPGVPPSDGSADSGAHPTRWDELTGAEQEVAVLAAAGMTNTAIAARRGTSRRTVDAQIAAILPKLMISTRKDIRTLLPPEHRAAADRESERRAARPR